jgi:hypothetical protein
MEFKSPRSAPFSRTLKMCWLSQPSWPARAETPKLSTRSPGPQQEDVIGPHAKPFGQRLSRVVEWLRCVVQVLYVRMIGRPSSFHSSGLERSAIHKAAHRVQMRVGHPFGFVTGSPNVSRKMDWVRVSSWARAARRLAAARPPCPGSSAIRRCSGRGGNGSLDSRNDSIRKQGSWRRLPSAPCHFTKGWT